MNLLYVAIVIVICTIAICTMVLMSRLSLEVNTIEQSYVFRLGRFFRIQYDCAQRGFRFSLFGCSWFKKPSWRKKKSEKKEERAKEEKVKEKRAKEKQPLLSKKQLLLFQKRKLLYGVLLRLKDTWGDLQRLSTRKLEVHLCTPDFMANALLAQIFAACQLQSIQVNYLEENWLIGYFALHLWVVVWILFKLALSLPVLKLGFFIIRGKLR